jgi:predicted transposase/invertase (TIGR01784 family)
VSGKEIYIKATSDIFIKYLFGMETQESNKLVLSFINAVLEDSDFPKIIKVIQKNPFNYMEFTRDKLSVRDIKVEDENHRIFNIEVQSSGDYGFRNRALYYWSKLYASKLENGDEYEKLLPTISINLLNFTLFHELTEYHNYFMITEARKRKFILTDHLIMHFLELPKITNLERSSKINHWLLYLKEEGSNNEMLDILIKDDDDFKLAHEKYESFTSDQQLRWLAIDREKAERDRIYHENIGKRKLEKALKEGLEQGIEQGIEQGKLLDKQDTLIRLLDKKFGVSGQEKQFIYSVKNPDILSAALDEILVAKKIDEILSVLKK